MKEKSINTIKLLLGLILMLSICLFQIDVFAVSTAKVLTVNEDIEMISENEYIVPIYISGNPGIMGFRLEFIYDKESVSINSVSKGSVTQIGSFDSVINSEGKWGRASAVWYNTEDVTDEGTLAYIGVIVHNQNDSIIRVGYVAEDTFNEKWEDVSLNCYNISFEDKSKNIDESLNNPSDLEIDNNERNSDEVSNSNELNKITINELTPEDLKKRDYNNNSYMAVSLSDGTLSLSMSLPSSDEIEEVKKNIKTENELEIKETAKNELQLQNVPPDFNHDSLKRSIINELVNEGYKSISEIPNDKKTEFWMHVKENYIDNNGTDKSLDKVDFEIFEGSIEIKKEEVDQAYSEKQNNLNIYIVIIGIIIIFIIFIAVKLIKKKSEINKDNTADEKKKEVEK